MKKKICILIIVVVCILTICPIPIKINESISGIQLAVSNIEEYESVNIKVEGIFYWKVIKLFGKDEFKGNISFSNYLFTQKKILEQNQKFEIQYNKVIPMDYYDKKNVLESKFLGHIGMTWKFQHFAVLVQSNSLNPKFIIAHANNQEEAFQELKFVEKAYNGLVEYKQLQSPKSK